MKTCLHTGGAVGADSYWGKRAVDLGEEIKLYTFDGHKKNYCFRFR